MATPNNLNQQSPIPDLYQARPGPGENGTETPETEICRNFIWGRCFKGPECKFRHELDFQRMTEVLKFCRDFQNRHGCRRDKCKYLHTTKEEESLFYSVGQLPRVLAESHARMMAAEATRPLSQIPIIIIQEPTIAPLPSIPPSRTAENGETEMPWTEPDLGTYIKRC